MNKTHTVKYEKPKLKIQKIKLNFFQTGQDPFYGQTDIDPNTHTYLAESCCGTCYSCSDKRLKMNVEKLDNVLDQMNQIKGVSFNWEGSQCEHGVRVKGRQIGVLAQDIEKVYPECVAYFHSKEGTKYKAVNYSSLTAILVEAVKELKLKNEALELRIKRVEYDKKVD